MREVFVQTRKKVEQTDPAVFLVHLKIYCLALPAGDAAQDHVFLWLSHPMGHCTISLGQNKVGETCCQPAEPCTERDRHSSSG